jgi:hypothetical protein
MNRRLKLATKLAQLMDNRFKVLGFRFGLDPILGLIPGAGDLVSLGLATYIILIAIRMGLPKEKIAQMIGNASIDLVVGAAPILGDLGDFFFKANLKNLEIIRQNS